ncbi:hypothetical protein ACQKIS_18885, partial [Pseudomonas fulva]
MPFQKTEGGVQVGEHQQETLTIVRAWLITATLHEMATHWKYDALGQLTKLIDAAGEETEYHYEAGYLSSLVYPDKTRDRFEYDAEGRLLTYVDALHRRTTWSYNEAGLIQQRLNPDASTLYYHWDKLGQLVRLR